MYVKREKYTFYGIKETSDKIKLSVTKKTCYY